MKTSQVREFMAKGGDTAQYIEKSIGDDYFKKASIDSAEDLELYIAALKMPERMNSEEFYSVQILHTKKDNEAGFGMRLELSTESLEYKGEEYFKFKRTADGMQYAYVPNKRVIVWSLNKKGIEMAIDAGAKGPQNLPWMKRWKEHSDKHFSIAVTGGTLKNMAQAPPPPFSTFARAESVVAGFNLGKKLNAEIQLDCAQPSDAKEIAELGEQLLSQGKLMLEMFDKDSSEEMKGSIVTGFDLIKETKFEVDQNLVTVETAAKVNLLDFLPAVEEVRYAAQRTTGMNNLRQVSLSFHNYHSATGGFPPPVLVSDAGKKYSWRIAILPYIEQQALYDEYRFDEEWNSPHNLEVTSKMPEVFRHPSDDPDSNNTSWHLVTGPGTIFGDDGPMDFKDMTDLSLIHI